MVGAPSDPPRTPGSPHCQRWRSIVKARTLVLAVHEHFLQKHREQTQKTDEDAPINSPDQPDNVEDAWTLEYINVLRLQPLIEVFDADASGFVSIVEVNELTFARPKEWRSVWAATTSSCMTP